MSAWVIRAYRTSIKTRKLGVMRLIKVKGSEVIGGHASSASKIPLAVDVKKKKKIPFLSIMNGMRMQKRPFVLTSFSIYESYLFNSVFL